MKKILSHLKGHRRESVLAPLFKLLEACLELLVPFVIAAIIDVGIPSGDAGYILRMGLLLAVLGLVGLAAAVSAQYFSARAATGLAARLRHVLFAHIQKLSYSDLNRIGTSTLVTRMTSDIHQLQTGVNLALRLLLRSPFIVFGAMIMAFVIDPGCGWIFAAAIAVLLLIVFGILLTTMPMHKKTQNQLDEVLLKTRENLNGVRVLRAFGQEEEQISSFSASHARLTRLQTISGRISALMNPLTCIAINFALVVLIRSGAVKVNAGTLTQGEVVALVNYMAQILAELIKLAGLVITISRAAACAKRIEAVLDVRPALVSPAKPESMFSPGCVEFDHVGMQYEGASSEALSDIHFHVRRGQIVGVIGGTGSGKSTLVSLIPRFYDASSGIVRVGGVDVRRQSISELRRRIAVVPQEAVLFKGSIRDNLLWGNPRASEQEISEALAAAQAEDIIAAKGGLDAMLDQGGRNLSGGQRQRLTIARALVRRPEILILDDSSSALDQHTATMLRMALRRLSYRPTVFIVSQRISSVRYADMVLVMEDGCIVGKGTHEELVSGCPVYREILKSQLDGEVSA